MEFAELLTKKKAAYPDYRKARDEMQELVRAQKNVERFFAEEKETTEKHRPDKRIPPRRLLPFGQITRVFLLYLCNSPCSICISAFLFTFPSQLWYNNTTYKDAELYPKWSGAAFVLIWRQRLCIHCSFLF